MPYLHWTKDLVDSVNSFLDDRVPASYNDRVKKLTTEALKSDLALNRCHKKFPVSSAYNLEFLQKNLGKVEGSFYGGGVRHFLVPLVRGSAQMINPYRKIVADFFVNELAQILGTRPKGFPYFKVLDNVIPGSILTQMQKVIDLLHAGGFTPDAEVDHSEMISHFIRWGGKITHYYTLDHEVAQNAYETWEREKGEAFAQDMTQLLASKELKLIFDRGYMLESDLQSFRPFLDIAPCPRICTDAFSPEMLESCEKRAQELYNTFLKNDGPDNKVFSEKSLLEEIQTIASWINKDKTSVNTERVVTGYGLLAYLFASQVKQT